ncbi:MAG: deaminase [Candidatus Paceibacterota bacterium]|jgi:dCMP deaminase
MTPVILAQRVLVAYVPVVHSAIIEWAKRENSPILVLCQEFIGEFPQLKHDLRAVSPELVVDMLKSLGFQASLLDFQALVALKMMSKPTFVLPTDEVMQQFAERYLVGQKVEHQRVFIRWDKINTTSENEVYPDRSVTSEQLAKDIMGLCYEHAKLSSDWWRQVGAAAVRDGQVLLYGVNRMKPTDYAPYLDGDIRGCFGFGERLDICGTLHAEAAVVAGAAARGLSLDGTDFYCTTFPCPQCARLLEAARVRRVIYDEGYSVCDTFDILKTAGVEIIKLIP